MPIQERTDSLAMGAAPGAWFHLAMTHAVVVSLPFHLSTPSDARNGLFETMPFCTYFVGSLEWTFSVWAHNAYGDGPQSVGQVEASIDAHSDIPTERKADIKAALAEHQSLPDVQPHATRTGRPQYRQVAREAGGPRGELNVTGEPKSQRTAVGNAKCWGVGLQFEIRGQRCPSSSICPGPQFSGWQRFGPCC